MPCSLTRAWCREREDRAIFVMRLSMRANLDVLEEVWENLVRVSVCPGLSYESDGVTYGFLCYSV